MRCDKRDGTLDIFQVDVGQILRYVGASLSRSEHFSVRISVNLN